MNDDFLFSSYFKGAARFWWLLAVLIIFGGLIGMLVTRLHKPVYESTSAITTSIDYAYAGRLDDVAQDQLIETVGDLIGSTEVMNKVVQRLPSENISFTQPELLKMMTRSRQAFRWELSVRASDLQIAQQINQFWLDAVLNKLVDARNNAIASIHVNTLQLSLEKCLSQAVVVEPASAACSPESLVAIRSAIEATASNDGILSNPESINLSKLSFEITEQPVMPTEPILFRQNINTLAGAVIGLFAGLGLLIFLKPKK